MGGGGQQGKAANRGSLGGAEATSCFPEPELQIESWADVSRSAVGARQLCSPAGTDQLGAGDKKAKAKKKPSRRGGSKSADAAVAIRSRANVGQLGSRFGILRNDEEADGGARGVVERAASCGVQ